MATDRKLEAALEDGMVLRGEAPKPRQVAAAKVRLEPAADFTFLHHFHQWDVVLIDEKPVLVPRLRQFHHEPGVAAVEDVKDPAGNGDPDRALGLLARKGWAAIPKSGKFSAFGEVFTNYVMAYPGHRGLVHMSVWKRPYVRGGQVITDFDEEGWHRWLAGLMSAGVVAPPDRVTKRAVELEFRQMMRRLQTSGSRSALAAEHAEVYEQKLGAFAVVSGGKVKAEPKAAPAPAKEE